MPRKSTGRAWRATARAYAQNPGDDLVEDRSRQRHASARRDVEIEEAVEAHPQAGAPDAESRDHEAQQGRDAAAESVERVDENPDRRPDGLLRHGCEETLALPRRNAPCLDETTNSLRWSHRPALRS
jgi:hypothetical protein